MTGGAEALVENQEYLSFGILDQRLQKLDQLVRVEGFINDHPARRPLLVTVAIIESF